MKEVRFTDYSYKLADIPAPRITTAKQWRRYQVLLKRLRESIDAHIGASIYGDHWGCKQQPTSWPPKQGRRGYPVFYINPGS